MFEFIKKELSGWKPFEIYLLLFVLGVTVFNAIVLKDSVVAIVSTICGIMYTIIAGKGKISCYIFGLTGSGFYCYLALSNAIYGNLILYLFYYIPMQIIGIFKWRQHLKKNTNEIYKTTLNNKERLLLSIFSAFVCVCFYLFLKHAGDSHPIPDSVTTILSVVGMYMTVRRAIEQWVVWFIVNTLSAYMWVNVLLSGEKVFSTVLMWVVYIALSVYFYNQWRKELIGKELGVS